MATFEAEQLLVLVLAESPLQLTWSFPPSSSPSLLDINRLEPQSDGCVVILPNATLSPTAQTAKFYNVGNHPVEIQLFGGGFLINLEVGEYYQFTLIDNTTTFGTWITVPYVAGAVNISNFTIAPSTTPSIVVTNGNVTATGQTVTLALPDTLLGLSNPEAGNLNSSGLLAYFPNGGNPLYYSRVLQSSDSNLVITNPNGVTGNPSFSLSPTLTGLSSVQVGTITINNDGLSSPGNNIVLSTGPTAGTVNLNGTEIDASGNTVVGGSLQINGAFNAPQMPIGWTRMTDTTTGETNTLTAQDAFNAVITHKVSGVGGTYTCTMPVPASNTYYGVQLSCGTASINSPPLIAQVIYSSITNSAFDFVVTDSGGTIVSEVPNSLTLTIFSTGNATDSLSSTVSAHANIYMSDNFDLCQLDNSNTLVIPGATVSNAMKHFNMDAPNKIVYTGITPIHVTVSAVASVSYSYLNAIENISLRVLKNGEDVLPLQYSCAAGQGKICAIPVEVVAYLVTGDYIQIGIATTNPPLSLGVEHLNVLIRTI